MTERDIRRAKAELPHLIAAPLRGRTLGAADAAFVVLNFASRPATVSLPAPGAGRGWRGAWSTAGDGRSESASDSIVLGPLEALVATA